MVCREVQQRIQLTLWVRTVTGSTNTHVSEQDGNPVHPPFPKKGQTHPNPHAAPLPASGQHPRAGWSLLVLRAAPPPGSAQAAYAKVLADGSQRVLLDHASMRRDLAAARRATRMQLGEL